MSDYLIGSCKDGDAPGQGVGSYLVNPKLMFVAEQNGVDVEELGTAAETTPALAAGSRNGGARGTEPVASARKTVPGDSGRSPLSRSSNGRVPPSLSDR